MSRKLAILQMADAGPAESTAAMLRAVGYDVLLPGAELRDELKRHCGGLVLAPRDLTRGMGYDPVDFPEAGVEDMERCDLYCDVKAHQVYERVVRRWPNLKGRVLWTRINGGRYEHVIRRDDRGNVIEDCGDEVNPPCPVLTPNRWYAHCPTCADQEAYYNTPGRERDAPCPTCGGSGTPPNFYAAWPPFVRFGDYYHRHGRPESCYQSPVCLIHNVDGWGYRDLVPAVRGLGVRVYGAGSPDGLVAHGGVPDLLSRALCMVHLKSSDAPGYSIYECLAAACPLVCTRRLIWRCKMHDLLVPGETCLVFDRETHEGLSEQDVRECAAEVKGHLERLRDPAENRRIGMAGHNRLKEVMWDANKKEDVESLRAFFERNFPQ